MGKKTSKLIAVVFALLLVLTMAVPAFAAEGESSANETLIVSPLPTGTITMSDVDATAAETDTFYVYQIMKVEYDSETNEVKYVPSTAFAAFLTSDKNTQPAINTFDLYQQLTDAGQIKQILGDFSAYCMSTEPPVANFTIPGNGTKTDVELGQYVINGVSTSEQSVFQVMTASFPVSVATEGENEGKYVVNTDVTVGVKKNKPTLDKTIPSGDIQYAIGQFVDYSIITTVPTYPASAIRKTYTIGDTCADSLTIDYEGTHEGITGIVVKASTTDANPESFTTIILEEGEGKDYQLIPDATTPDQKFLLEFDYDKIADYKAIQVLYYAEVNSNAVVTTGMENEATFTYSTDPYQHTGDDAELKDKEKVFSYGIDMVKVDQDDETKKLAGAEFKLYLSTDTEFASPIKFVAPTAPDTDYTVAKETDTNTVEAIPTDANGQLLITGLDVGSYVLRETKAPIGYSLPADEDNQFVVEIKDEAADAETPPDGLIDTEDPADGIVEYEVTNVKAQTTLPQTGGVGTILFIGIGLAGMIIAVVVFAILRKKAKKDQ